MSTLHEHQDKGSTVEAAIDFRQRGNFEFSNGRCDEAVALYTAALLHCQNVENDPTHQAERVLNLCNRSACYSQQEEWELGQQDASEAWKLSNYKSVKAAYRLAKCSLKLKDYETAKATIQAALRVLDDQALQSSVQTAASKGSEMPPESMKPDDMPVPVPKIGEGTISTNLDHTRQRSELNDLWKQTLTMALNHATEKPETSIKFVKRPISIKEFQISKQLGHGNFSEIYMVQHKVTNEFFALKKIEKKQAADLFKRQHPNVFNEIQMERRVLLERISNPGHPYIVRMYHAFQDYNSLYYLMDLHTERKDLWSQLRYKNLPGYGTTSASEGESLVMMGCHRSSACVWLYELLSALDYIHSRGIVHRDLKAENILLSATGHIIVIDFGTAKDLLQTDLNGPEFVGTPDFMSPEAVTGTDQSDESSIGQYSLLSDSDSKKKVQAGPEADLWALGALAFILQTGHTPYWSPSPYLAFLKIKRSLQFENLLRPTGIVDSDCWDFILQLMQGDPNKRIGAGTYTINNIGAKRTILCQPGGYNVIRQHPYFRKIHTDPSNTTAINVNNQLVSIPSLLDICIRACAEMAYRESQDYELCEKNPPGNGSKHDLLRLHHRERAAVMHCLDRRRLLSDPRLYARFFCDVGTSRLDKIRLWSRDVVGLTQMNDDQGKPPKGQMNDPYAKPIETDPIKIVLLTNPLFCPGSENLNETNRKKFIKLLKKCIVTINQNRPKLVVVMGSVNESARRIICKISETIPTVVHDGTSFFAFWRMGVQSLALNASIMNDNSQISWLKQQLEQVRLAKYPLFVFISSNVCDISPFILKKLAQGRALCVFALSPYVSEDESLMSTVVRSNIAYEANEIVDDVSIRSTESLEDEKDNFTTKIMSTCASGLHWIAVDEEPDKWTVDFEAVVA